MATTDPLIVSEIGKNISSHVLDTANGFPAAGMGIKLYVLTTTDANATTDTSGDWLLIGNEVTNSDGRAKFLFSSFPDPTLSERTATYKALFDTQSYFQLTGTPTFYPKVEIYFRIVDTSIHYHIPLLISPYGYSTYKGS